jgi:hypothetical protein
MKKILLTLALLVGAAPVALPQESAAGSVEDEADRRSSVSFSGSPYDFIFSWKKKAKKSHRPGIGFAFSNLEGLGDVGVDLNRSRSYSVVLNIGEHTVPLNQNWLMATGLGFDWSRYHFRGNRSLQSIGGRTVFYLDDGREYRSSRFLIYYATVPLVLEYQAKVNRAQTFFVYGGLEGLIKLYSKSQAEIKTASGTSKETYRGLHLLPLNYRFTARMGLGGVSLFGYYQPLSMFEKGKGPDVHPCGLGLMLSF